MFVTRRMTSFSASLLSTLLAFDECQEPHSPNWRWIVSMLTRLLWLRSTKAFDLCQIYRLQTGTVNAKPSHSASLERSQMSIHTTWYSAKMWVTRLGTRRMSSSVEVALPQKESQLSCSLKPTLFRHFKNAADTFFFFFQTQKSIEHFNFLLFLSLLILNTVPAKVMMWFHKGHSMSKAFDENHRFTS